MRRRTCPECGVDIPYDGSAHDGSSRCHIGRELRKIQKIGLVAVSPPAPTSSRHTIRVGTIEVCKILGLDYKLVPSKAWSKPWVCVTPEVEATLRAVNEAAKFMMVVIPGAARQLADKRDVLMEFDSMRRLGADHGALFDILALGGAMGERAQFEARCTQRNPNRSDRSIAAAWEKFRRRRIIHARVEDAARNLKNKP